MITQNPRGQPGAQTVKIWMARALAGLQPAPAQITAATCAAQPRVNYTALGGASSAATFPALQAPRALAPLIGLHRHSSCNTRAHGARELAQPDPGLYLAGMKSYGRAPGFLMTIGYVQVRSIVTALTGNVEAAQHADCDQSPSSVCACAPSDNRTPALLAYEREAPGIIAAAPPARRG
jgi:hypothetical protein